MLDDAVDLALRDQEEAGIDVVSDGEMRRAGFFTAEFYRHLTGVRALPPDRRLGAGGHDQQHRFEVLEPIAAPDGLGVVAEYRYAAEARTTRPLKVTLPGPYTLSGRLTYGPGQVYATRNAAAEAFVPILQRRARGPRRRRCDVHPDRRAVAGDPPRRPGRLLGAVQRRRRARRRPGPARGPPLLRELPRPAAGAPDLPARSSTRCSASDVDELVLEFANREMAEVEILRRDRRRRPRRRRGRHRRQELPTSRRPTRSPSGSTPSWRPASRPSGSRSSPTAASARPPAGRRRAKLRALVAGRDLVRSDAKPPGGGLDERPRDHDARHRADRRLLHDHAPRPARPRPRPRRLLAQPRARRRRSASAGRSRSTRPT